MDLIVASTPTTYQGISIYGITGQDTIRAGSFGVPRNYEMTLHYHHSDSLEKVVAYRGRDYIGDYFVLYNPPVELSDWKKISFFNDVPYEDQLKTNIALVTQRPDAHYLMANFSDYASRYQSISDLRVVFDLFSDEQKESYYGKRTNQYINGHTFTNYKLVNAITGVVEPIIIDTTKQTLVIFSASWCAPCHALIPQLKEVYEKHKGELEFVYVSSDDPETFDSWRALIDKEQIPWRSLFVKQYAKDEAIYREMIIPFIPYAMLVDWDMSMERIKISKHAVRDQFFKWLDEQ